MHRTVSSIRLCWQIIPPESSSADVQFQRLCPVNAEATYLTFASEWDHESAALAVMWIDILQTCPDQHSRRSPMMPSAFRCCVLYLTLSLEIMSFHEMRRIFPSLL